MATQITVAVGANGEILRAQSLRDGARADRLDSEGTRQQAKNAATEQLDDDAAGRDNKKSKYGSSRDPAAHARKKPVTEGQFVGLRIRYEHFPLTNIKWEQARDRPYMRIFVRGVTPEGQLTDEKMIELQRTLNTDTFRCRTPDGYVRDSFIWPGYSAGNGPWGLSNWPEPSAAFYSFAYTPADKNKYAIQEGGIAENGAFQPYGYFWWEFREVSNLVIEPIGGSTSFPVWYQFLDPVQLSYEPPLEGYPEYGNVNKACNGRVSKDSEITNWTDFHLDPVHELFMLPYTSEICFLLVVMTDYMIQTECGAKVVAKARSEANGSLTPDVYIDGRYQNMQTTRINLERFAPEYCLPDGVKFTDNSNTVGPWFGTGPRIEISEAGGNKIQTIHLYKIKNGEVSIVEEVPEALRTKVSELSTDLKGFVLNELPTVNYVGSTKQKSCFYDRLYGRLDSITEDGDNEVSHNYLGPKAMILGSTGLAATARDSRTYLDNKTEERSIGKGYGIGDLKTGNHFNSVYLLSDLHGFYDDFYFTPMVYEYLKGNAECSLLYSRAAEGTAIEPEYFVDVGSAADSGMVSFAKERPSRVDASYTGEWLGTQEVPGLKNSTHMCWNWNRPDRCWDELTALGFTQASLGPRPEDPTGDK